ncbi:conserved hypothetical protein [Candidatus Desulfarcum epimagneticum]|uniref:PglD N-terminal domain-containing protein n=1 Tax=uncultured Desulfobacteraceae bacterium TaxID=218296 RepID=A0A484HF53_9BACT|nr:conserved hypothetical protein [uncultured Desulfobacteraceae bacterium]
MNSPKSQDNISKSEKKSKIIIIGAGAHAKYIIDILEEMNCFEIIGCCASDPSPSGEVCGYPFLGDFKTLSELFQTGVRLAAIGIGGWTDNHLREKIFNMAKDMGFKLVNPIHPRAIVASNARIGEGSSIGAGAVVNTEASIGKNVIIGADALIGHETEIHDHVLVSGSVKVGAQLVVKKRALLAFGATIVSRVNIGREALVGAGSVVIKDVADRTRVFGVAATQRD